MIVEQAFCALNEGTSDMPLAQNWLTRGIYQDIYRVSKSDFKKKTCHFPPEVRAFPGCMITNEGSFVFKGPLFHVPPSPPRKEGERVRKQKEWYSLCTCVFYEREELFPGSKRNTKDTFFCLWKKKEKKILAPTPEEKRSSYAKKGYGGSNYLFPHSLCLPLENNVMLLSPSSVALH